jgi:hypothetical protein
MDFNKTVDLIIRDLEEAREIIDDLKNYPGVPVIQIEMAKSKCRNAAEVIALFKEKQTSSKTEVRNQKSEVKSPEPEDVSPKPVASSVKAESPLRSERKKAEATIPKPVAGSRLPEAGIIADTFDSLPNSLNEKLGSLRDDNDVPDFLKSKPLTNLSQAIGINDRFLFIRELFNGNSETYSQAIIKIEEAKSLSDAKALMLDFTGDKIESEAGMLLLDLVKRKFPGDE